MTELSSALPPLPSRQELRDVDIAWDAFMAGDSRGLEKVRPVIRESWQRSHQLGIDPHQTSFPAVLSAEDLEAMQERVVLVAVATPLFETILQAWEDHPFMLGVSDRRGRLLYTARTSTYHGTRQAYQRGARKRHGGSLFLDEVEAMSPKMQVSLLRVLEERRLARLGGERPVSVDVRIIAASNEDLRTAVEQKRFRVDLQRFALE